MLQRDCAPFLRCDPVIDVGSVRQALDSLLYSTRTHSTTSLENLWLVDQALLDPDHPPMGQGRAYELAVVLTDLIAHQLARHRRASGLPLPPDSPSRAEAFVQIALDGQTANIELMSWSWLYYRYVRVELGITLAEYEAAAAIEPRTRRRYREHALRRLTQQLIARERTARRALRKQRLLARLPSAPPTRLFGRERELATLTQALIQPTARIVQVNGAAGLGKTSLVREAVRTLIEADQLTQLAWIRSPESAADCLAQVRQWITAFERGDQSPVFAPQGGLIVVDDLAALSDSPAELEHFVAHVAPMHVCLIHPTPLVLNDLNVSLPLRPLSLADAEALIQWQMFLRPELGLTAERIAAVIRSGQGNPAAILRHLQAELDE